MKNLPVNRLLAIACLLLLTSLLSCSYFTDVLKDHPCCVPEKQALTDATRAYNFASDREAPSGKALKEGEAELKVLEKAETDCNDTTTDPLNVCKKQRVAANNQFSAVTILRNTNRPLKEAKDAAEASRVRAETALHVCVKANNNCTP